MATQAEGTFQLSSFDENTYDEFGKAKLTRATIVQEFSGDLRATGTCETLMCYAEDGTATFVGLQRMVGTLGGRSGSFVVQANGGYDGGAARTMWTVVPGSGTDGLRDLHGEGSSVAPGGPGGSYTLEYTLA